MRIRSVPDRIDALPLVHPRYLPREILGRGGQGMVLRVLDREAPGRALVAKVFQPGAFDPSALYGEFSLLARLALPSVVRAHDLGHDERTGAPFLVEDFVPGDDAATYVAAAVDDADKNARFGAVLSGVAAAFAGLHDAGFLHGDPKPAHVRMQAGPGRPRAVLLDLGAAAMRARPRHSPPPVSPGYAAPEVLAGAPPSPRSDLYGLGALAWAAAAGAPPSPTRARRPLRTFCPWLRPSFAELCEVLVEVHPRDRPEDALEVLARLGTAAAGAGLVLGAPPSPIGREREISVLLSVACPPVRYVVGPSGAGKSHLVRELVIRALCLGQSARLVALPHDEGSLVPRLITFLRGDARALPFAWRQGEESRLLVVLDDLEAGPAELATALDVYRCRGRTEAAVDVVATCRAAPPGAFDIPLGPLPASDFEVLCTALGVTGEDARRVARETSGGLPGWLLASLGRVPLSRELALARALSLASRARELLAAIALSGGALPEELLAALASEHFAAALAELLGSSLVNRRMEAGKPWYALSSSALAAELAAAIAGPELADRVAELWLAAPSAPAAALFSVAQGLVSKVRREELLLRAAARARADGFTSLERKALLELAEAPGARTPELLCRLERLTRDTGGLRAHPEVLGWLEEAAAQDERLAPLALRRRAEERARAGDMAGARALAEQALSVARALEDGAAEAFARATLGLVSLFSARWIEAEAELVEARTLAAAAGADDPEEIARMEHNAGACSLYRGDAEAAVAQFSAALTEKRRLGDRAGMRSCSMNLGMALGRAGRYGEACAALDEATLLARSLGQEAGLGWCLFARAEVELREGKRDAAERLVAEARALGAALPAVVRADLAILRAKIRALEGDGSGALAALDEVPVELCVEDALLDVRARLAKVLAHLATLPANPRWAARVAIGALRRARAAALTESEAEAKRALQHALEARRNANAPDPKAVGRVNDARDNGVAMAHAASGEAGDEAMWSLLASASRADQDPAETTLDLARLVIERAGAERAFVVTVDGAGKIKNALGVDLDGLPLAEAERRIDEATVRVALGQEEPVYRRDVVTPGGRGARIAVAGPAGPAGWAVVLAEHRFAPGRFDGVGAGEAMRWATIASILLRLSPLLPVEEAERKETEPRESRAERRIPGSRDGGAKAPEKNSVTTVVPLSGPRRSFPGLLGDAPALKRALARLEAALEGDLPVLFVGETGVGKEIFARVLHEAGSRAAKPFIAMNCGAIPDALFEAELFGHARGAFTGADRPRAGMIAQAEGGTLFFDEIGELPLARQATLLRVLETRRYRPVGSDEERAFDLRIVAATNQDLETAVTERSFRQDLYYRINALMIQVPPLRERAEDLPLLARAFLSRAGSSAVLAEDALEALSAYPWPGNVRELRHVMERLAALPIGRIERVHLPRTIRERAPIGLSTEVEAEDERAPIRRALAETGGNISRAAELLGLSRQGLKKRMVRLGMRESKAKAS